MAKKFETIKLYVKKCNQPLLIKAEDVQNGHQKVPYIISLAYTSYGTEFITKVQPSSYLEKY